MKKKERSQLFVSIVSIICVFLSGFCIWHYWSSQPGADEGDLTITITYPDYNINRVTPLPEMECAADKNFSNMFHLIRSQRPAISQMSISLLSRRIPHHSYNQTASNPSPTFTTMNRLRLSALSSLSSSRINRKKTGIPEHISVPGCLSFF